MRASWEVVCVLLSACLRVRARAHVQTCLRVCVRDCVLRGAGRGGAGGESVQGQAFRQGWGAG